MDAVEDENRRNSEADDAHNILGSFLKAQEETMDELVGGFLYLTMDELHNSTASSVTSAQSSAGPSVITLAPVENKGTVSSTASDTGLAAASKSVTAAQHIHADACKREGGDINFDDDNLETEVPEDTTKSMETVLCQDRPPSLLTKFNNLVIDDDEQYSEDEQEEGEEEDWMPTSGYMASFGDEEAMVPDPSGDDKPSPTETKESKGETIKAQATQKHPAEVMIIPPPHPHPQHGRRSKHRASSHARTAEKEEGTCLSTQTSAGQGGTLKNKEAQILSQQRSAQGDDGQSASASTTACTTEGDDKDATKSSTGGVEEGDEVSTRAATDSTRDTDGGGGSGGGDCVDAPPYSSVCDDDGDGDDDDDDDVATNSVVCVADDVEAPPASTLNPGEAEDDDEAGRTPVSPTIRVLEVSTVTLVDPSPGDSTSSLGHLDEDACSDEVVPFELEQGYDYDTVVYTPKFTPAEMNYLASFMPSKSS